MIYAGSIRSKNYMLGSVTDEKKFNANSDVYADNYFDFADDLEGIFKRKVDLITTNQLRNRFFIQQVNQSKQKIYET